VKTIQSQEQGNLNQVWVQLNREHQARVIQLMAQLVLKLVMEQLESSQKEVRDEQNPG